MSTILALIVKNLDVKDFFVQSPMFDTYHRSETIVVKPFSANCSLEFRSKLRCRAFEHIFNLDHLTPYSDRVTFFSTVHFE